MTTTQITYHLTSVREVPTKIAHLEGDVKRTRKLALKNITSETVLVDDRPGTAEEIATLAPGGTYRGVTVPSHGDGYTAFALRAVWCSGVDAALGDGGR